jgi:hypothetical protein
MVLVTETKQFRASAHQIHNDLDDIICTQAQDIPVKRSTKWRNTTPVGIVSKSEVFQ